METRWIAFFTGVLAGLVTVSASLVLRGVTGRESVVEVIGAAILQSIPVAMFSFLLEALGTNAKPLLLLSVILGFIAVGGGIGVLVPPGQKRRGYLARLRDVATLSFGLWVPLLIVVILATNSGTVEPMTNQRVIDIALAVAAESVMFVVSLHVISAALSILVGQSTRVDIDAPPVNQSRRRLLTHFAIVSVAVASGGYTARFVRRVGSGLAGDERTTISSAITPVGAFYVVSKNFVDPSVAADAWELQVTGRVERPQTFRLAELRAFPAFTQQTTLTCISNPIGGDLISNGEWTGVRLAELLGRVGIRQHATEVVLYAYDGYTESLPLSKALESTTLLVYLMNGASLTRSHGFPARLVVPGRYGIKNVKWLRRIDVIAGDYRGFWQQRGWTDEATIRTMSRIDLPRPRSIVS